MKWSQIRLWLHLWLQFCLVLRMPRDANQWQCEAGGSKLWIGGQDSKFDSISYWIQKRGSFPVQANLESIINFSGSKILDNQRNKYPRTTSYWRSVSSYLTAWVSNPGYVTSSCLYGILFHLCGLFSYVCGHLNGLLSSVYSLSLKSQPPGTGYQKKRRNGYPCATHTSEG